MPAVVGNLLTVFQDDESALKFEPQPPHLLEHADGCEQAKQTQRGEEETHDSTSAESCIQAYKHRILSYSAGMEMCCLPLALTLSLPIPHWFYAPTAKAGAMPLRASTVVRALAYVAMVMPKSAVGRTRSLEIACMRAVHVHLCIFRRHEQEARNRPCKKGLMTPQGTHSHR